MHREKLNSKFKAFIPPVLLLGMFLFFFPAFLSASGERLSTFYCLLVPLFIISFLKPPYQLATRALWVGMFAFFFITVGGHILQLFIAPFYPCATSQAAVRSEVERLHPKYIYVDEFALNVVYNYNLPSNGKDYSFSQIPWILKPLPQSFPPGSVLVVTRETAICMYKRLPLYAIVKPRKPSDEPLYTWKLGNPYDCVIITTDRTANGSPPNDGNGWGTNCTSGGKLSQNPLAPAPCSFML